MGLKESKPQNKWIFKKRTMKTKLVSLLLLSGFILSGCNLFESKFPIKYHICAKGYKDCKVYAKFDNMDSCQRHARLSGWYCDSRDPKNIICEEKESEAVDSYCSK